MQCECIVVTMDGLFSTQSIAPASLQLQETVLQHKYCGSQQASQDADDDSRKPNSIQRNWSFSMTFLVFKYIDNCCMSCATWLNQAVWRPHVREGNIIVLMNDVGQVFSHEFYVHGMIALVLRAV